VFGIEDDLVYASEIQLIRTNPTAFVEISVVGSESNNRRRIEESPDFLTNSEAIIKYVRNNIEERMKRGFNSVKTELFEDSFWESTNDEVLIKFGINLDHFWGYSLKRID
jgi:hypothetical protein